MGTRATSGRTVWNLLIKTVVIGFRASLVAQLIRNQLAMQETPVQSLGQEDPLEKG